MGPRRTLTGAWIETCQGAWLSGKKPVAPSRVRGLKPGDPGLLRGFPGRTLTGAWIETMLQGQRPTRFSVAPSRVRGLKQKKKELIQYGLGSHPHGCVD